MKLRFENSSQCRQWSGDEEDEGTRSSGHATTEHPLAEATIPLVSHSRLQEPSSSVLNVNAHMPTGGSQNATHRASQNQQESVLQKFRKSFSLRFHKKGSKESNEECPADDNDGSGPLDEEEGRETPPVTSSSEQSNQHKDDSGNEQKFRFVSVRIRSYPFVPAAHPFFIGNFKFRFEWNHVPLPSVSFPTRPSNVSLSPRRWLLAFPRSTRVANSIELS